MVERVFCARVGRFVKDLGALSPLEEQMNQPLEELTSSADRLYDAREQLANVHTLVRYLEEAENTSEFEVAWRLGRALFFLGQEAQTEEEARSYYARAVLVCNGASRVRPERVEGHFWLGVNLALLARVETPFNALLEALRARRSLMRAVRIDPGYHAAGPLRVLARLQHRLPRLLGGSTARALRNFERAIAIAPQNTVTRYYLAEMMLENGDETRARVELEALMKAPRDPSWRFESTRDRENARRMLDQLGR